MSMLNSINISDSDSENESLEDETINISKNDPDMEKNVLEKMDIRVLELLEAEEKNWKEILKVFFILFLFLFYLIQG
jgi:hypothetical protein